MLRKPVEDVARQSVQLKNGIVHLNDVAVCLEQRHARRQIVEHEPAHLGFTRDVLFLFLQRGDVAHDDQQVPVRGRMEIEFGPNPVRHLPDMRTVAACQGLRAPLRDEFVLRQFEAVITAAIHVPQDLLVRPARSYQLRRQPQQPAGAVRVFDDHAFGIDQRDRVANVPQHVRGARQLAGALAQLMQQARVFHRDHRLGREIPQEGDLLFRERSDILAEDREDTEHGAVPDERHRQAGASAAEFDERPDHRIVFPV